ncbi:MAG: hypothetical protein WAQ22_04360 [Candidatus Saccharimonas sp.]
MRNEKLNDKDTLRRRALKGTAMLGIAASALGLGGCYQHEASAEAPQSQDIETTAPQESGAIQSGEDLSQSGEIDIKEPVKPFALTFEADGSIDNEKTCADFSSFMNDFNSFASEAEINKFMAAKVDWDNTHEDRTTDEWSKDFAKEKIERYAPAFFGEGYQSNPDIAKWLKSTEESLYGGTIGVFKSSYKEDPRNKEVLVGHYNFSQCTIEVDQTTNSFSLSTDVAFTTNAENTKLDTVTDKNGHWTTTGTYDESGNITAKTFDY